ncbi:MAG: hypothetical protein IPH35_16120 [Rhodoferax sp.]|nr:hypothetical protein [Rhodoferax sp.]
MKSFKNSGKDDFLSSFPSASIDIDTDPLASRCKFNFSYFEVQKVGQNFADLKKETLIELFDKLKEYSKESLDYWRGQRVGKSGTIFATYGGFPARSDFTHPKHVPHQVEWGRFRLDWSFRLCGFTVPKSYNGTIHKGKGYIFCSNTFYVVFLDENHKFYKNASEEK